MITERDVEKIMNLHFLELEEYCKALVREYDATLDGDIRIEYNHLYPFLYSPLSDNKKAKLFNKLNIKFGKKGLYF
jgi:hypothetical protein